MFIVLFTFNGHSMKWISFCMFNNKTLLHLGILLLKNNTSKALATFIRNDCHQQKRINLSICIGFG